MRTSATEKLPSRGGLSRSVTGALFLVLLWCLWTATHEAIAFAFSNPVFLRQRRLVSPCPRQREVQEETVAYAYDVQLNLAILYLNDTVASQLESKEPSNAVVLHFCKSVNKQASGNQVRTVSSAIGATFQTPIDNSGSTPDYQCTILQTNRSYDNDAQDILGRDFFILELAVEQVVYVTTSTEQLLSQEKVEEIVELGFNRGAGGRVGFRSLLRDMPEFSTVVNVEVLNDGLPNSSSSTIFPTEMPSVAPTIQPTTPPTLYPTSGPTLYPTRGPTLYPTNRPSVYPTMLQPAVDPSGLPSIAPSVRVMPSRPPTDMPSSLPSQQPSSSPSQQSVGSSGASNGINRNALIFGAIAGGVATILVSCFFIFCVWSPFCGRKDDDSAARDAHPSSSKRHRSSSQSSPETQGAESAAIVPIVVEIDDDHESLADTTLGERTAGALKKGRPADGNASVRMFADSFDENSIYTSTNAEANFSVGSDAQAASAPSTNAAITFLPPSLSRPLEYEEDIVFPMSSRETDSSAEASAVLGGHATNDSGPVDLDEVSEDDVAPITKSSGSSSSSFDADEKIQSDEEKAKQVSHTMDTKGFDPFSDGTSDSSAFEFESSVGGQDRTVFDQDRTVFRPDDADAQSSPSMSSSRTKKVQNRVLASAPGDRQRSSHPAEEEKLEVEEEIRAEAESESEIPPPSDILPPSPVAKSSNSVNRRVHPAGIKSNNNLLRSVLEDARKLSEAKSPSNRSRLSAPSSLSMRRDWSNRITSPPPHDLLADIKDLEEALPRASRPSFTSSSRSVDEAYLLPSEAKKDIHPYRTKPAPPRASRHSNDRSPSAALRRVKEATPLRGNSRKETVAPSPLSSEASPPPETGLGTLGAEPRDESYESVQARSPETPASSPGVLGIAVAPKNAMVSDDASSESEGLSNPWLFDAIEQTLGPRSPAADMESIGGRSSRSGKSYRSSRSYKTQRSQRSNNSASSSKSSPSKAERSTASRPSTAVSVVDGVAGEHKSGSEEPLTPRSLEYDLRRLEIQLSDALQADSDQITTSTITASSAGASRSTLSTRRVAAKPQLKPPRHSKRKRMVIDVPPGKLGVVLADRHDGKGAVVSEVRTSSSMNGKLSPGDKLVAVDGEDVTGMVVSQITALMASKIDRERRLTVVTTASLSDLQETKHEFDESN